MNKPTLPKGCIFITVGYLTATVSEQLKDQINSLQDLELLKNLCKQAAVITSLANFQQLLTPNQGEK
jgi:hypothetical protein